MKILVTGARGMLAATLVPTLRERGHRVVALDRESLDVTDPDAVRASVEAERLDAVIQCAAYTAVDAAESDEETAVRVNAEAARHVARACQRTGALFVYPSTDYVFPGNGSRPYRPGDPTAPVNAYGRSKLAGEVAAREAGRTLVVRTSWLYGAGGSNFVDTIGRLARERDRIEVVDDQVGRPTWTGSLAEMIGELVEAGATGTFHASDGGEPVSWFGFAREIVALRGAGTVLVPVSSGAFPRPAPRPAFSVLDCSHTESRIGRTLRDWKGSLARYLCGDSPRG